MTAEDIPESGDTPPDQENSGPILQHALEFLRYGLSLPERTIRASTAMVGGILRETAAWAVPSSFQDSRSYQMFVRQALDFATRDIGGVESSDATANSQPGQAEVDLARKAASTFVDLAGIATLHVSPLTVLALVSDLAYGSQTFLRELAEELKQQGIIESQSTIDSTSDLLAALSQASGKTAEAFDQPPLDLEALRETIQQTATAVREIDPKLLIPQEEIGRVWRDMREIATRQNVNLFQVASATTLYTLQGLGLGVQGAMTTVRVTADMLNRHVLDHYAAALSEITEKGLYSVVAEASRPYVAAVWYNFQQERPTLTDDMLTGRMLGKAWSGFRELLGTRSASAKPETESPTRHDSSADG
jgi:hypothetical protein